MYEKAVPVRPVCVHAESPRQRLAAQQILTWTGEGCEFYDRTRVRRERRDRDGAQTGRESRESFCDLVPTCNSAGAEVSWS